MLPAESKEQFESLIAASGKTLAILTPADGISLMLDFYRQIRAQGCLFEDDGEMLVFQCGDYKFGQNEMTYQYNLTRQFIVAHENSDGTEISQLSLTYHFAVTDELRGQKTPSTWCSSPEKSEEFEQFIKDHSISAAVSVLRPLKTTLEFQSDI